MRIYNDQPKPWDIGFQDGATNTYYSMIELYNSIVVYVIIIGISIIWIIISIKVQNKEIGNKYIHMNRKATTIEIIWTIIPAIILIAIAIPSFKLLYLNESIEEIEKITIKVIGHQWYWEYEYGSKGYTSYLIPTTELGKGEIRLLEVDNKVKLPVLTPIKALVTSVDVIHSWAIPSLGVKIDAIPGRINQVNMIINRIGTYLGFCSEYCGSNHYGMPVVIEATTLEKFISWLMVINLAE